VTLPADGEDVALDALKSVFLGAPQGRFPLLSDRDDLWSLLVVITRRKAANLVRDEKAARRGGGKVQHASTLPTTSGQDDGPLFGEVIGKEPDPAFVAALSERFVCLLDQLKDATEREVAVLKMQGHTNREIAAKLGCSGSTVELKFQVIRKTWAAEKQPGEVSG
jgi:DNA-directed RNA polymerase specialized sigma24 family protein